MTISKYFRNFSIRIKLIIIIFLLSVFSTLLFALSFIHIEKKLFKSSLVAETASIAELLGENSSASLLFYNSEAAQSLLLSLRRKENIRHALILDGGNKIFASYYKDGDKSVIFPEPSEKEHYFTEEYLVVSKEIKDDVEVIGKIVLYSDLQILEEQVNDQIKIILIVFTVLTIVTLIIASQLQKTISNPIKELIVATKKVAQGDYTFQLALQSKDEMGQLSSSFKEMTKQLHNQEQQLLKANENLGKKVQQRTQDLEREKVRAEKASQAKSDFLANMSHEIRTPLSGVLGMNNLLLETPLTEKQKVYVESIKQSGTNLMVVINDILDFSKLEAGKLSVEMEILSLKDTLKEVFLLWEHKFQEKGLKYTFKMDDNVPRFIETDKNRLKQILINLYSNALKFTEEGVIKMEVSAKEGDNGLWEIVFKLTDSGIGISEDKVKDIFSTFDQGDSSITKKYGGTGLGLAISRHLALLLGGDLYCESKLGEGSVFYLNIAAKSKKELKQEEPIDLKEVKLPEMTIMVAEDNPINQQLIKFQLQQLGYQPSFAENGVVLLKKLQKEPVDVILMDLQMPEMDGITATKEIIKVYQKSRPYIIALTANAFKEDEEKCYAAGMDDYLTKPLDVNKLVKSLKRFAEKTVVS